MSLKQRVGLLAVEHNEIIIPTESKSKRTSFLLQNMQIPETHYICMGHLALFMSPWENWNSCYIHI